MAIEKDCSVTLLVCEVSQERLSRCSRPSACDMDRSVTALGTGGNMERRLVSPLF